MFITSSYILKRLCASIGVLATILVVLLWLTQSLKFIEVIVNHNVSLQGYFSLIVYLLPDMFVKVAPVCTLIGALLAYGKLTLDNELQVMQALGKSPWQILHPGMVLAGFLTLSLLFLNIFTIPNAYRAFRAQEFQLRNQFSSSIVRDGSFNVIKSLTIFVEKRRSAKEFEGVFIHDNGEHSEKKAKKPYTIFAKEGILKKINNQYVLVLHNGTRQEKDNNDTVQSFEFDELVYNFDSFTTIVNTRNLKPYEKDIRELFQVNNENSENSKLQMRMAAEGHQRILLPFLCLINMLMVALTMLVNRPSRRLRRKRIIYLILAGVIFQWLILNLLQLQLRFHFSAFIAYCLVITSLIMAFIALRYGKFHHTLQRLFERCGI
ncbi:MAG: LptF/LptG family permease [Proteobacteria bacterium]|nr:LptF/LptG family permease [Pseudomonadota bacterium]